MLGSAEIKAAYRKLAREHRPDALRAKGVPIDAMRQSEEVLKKINDAYAYLNRGVWRVSTAQN